MLQYFETLQDENGNALSGATATVTNYPSGSTASIYSTNGTASPITGAVVTADVTGQISFWAEDGAYTIVYAVSGTPYKTKSPVQMMDPMGQVLATDTGAANAYVVSNSAYPLSLYVGLKVQFKAANANTGSCTFNLNSTGTQPLNGTGGAALSAGTIPANGIIYVQWDGTQWQMLATVSQPYYSTNTAELALIAASKISVVNNSYPVGYVDRYCANAIPGSTDMSPGFNSAFLVANAFPCAVKYGATGPYATSNPINYTTTGGPNQNGVVTQYDGAGSGDSANQMIIANHNGHVFDCTGTVSLQFERIGIQTGASNHPQTAFFQARNISGGSVGISRFFNCFVEGSYSVACYYNFGAEDDQVYGGYWENQYSSGAAKVFTFTGANISALTSTFQSLPASAGCTDHKIFGGEIYRLGANAADDCVELDSIESVRIFAAWMHCATGSASGRSLIHFNLTNAASNFCTFEGIVGEQTTNVANYGIFVDNAPTSANTYICVNTTVDSCKFPNATYSIATGTGTNTTLSSWHLRQVGDPQQGHGINITGTLANSTIIDPNMVISIRLSQTSLLVGNTNNWTITSRSNDFWVDTGSVNKTWTPSTTNITHSGTLTVTGAKCCLVGNLFYFQFTITAGTSITCAAGSTVPLPTMAGAQLAVSGRSGIVNVVNADTPVALGNGVCLGNNIVLPAFTVTTADVTISGWACVA